MLDDKKLLEIISKNGCKKISEFNNLYTNKQIEYILKGIDLIENDNINLQFYEGSVVGLELPENVTLKVEETEAVVKGQTAASSYKPALLTGGIKTSVPPFISTEDFVVISTTDSSYIEKAKKYMRILSLTE